MIHKLDDIDAMVAAGQFEQAVAALDAMIQAEPESDELLYRRGKLHWRMGDKRRALSDYNAAVAINADSPAALLLGQATDIMDFYHRDLYNP